MAMMRRLTATQDRHLPFAAAGAACLLLLGYTASLFNHQLQPLCLGLSGLALTGAFAIALWSRSDSGAFSYSGPLWLLGALWLWWLVLTVVSPVRYVSEGATWTLAALPASAAMALWLRHSRFFKSVVVSGIGLILAVLALYACYQFFVEASAPSATFRNKNSFAALQMLVALGATGIALERRQRWQQWAGLSLMTLLVFVIGLIGSRGALLTVVTAMVILVAVAWRKGAALRTVAITSGLFAAALVSAQLASMGRLGSRVASLAEPLAAGSSRFTIWEGSWNLALEVPWYGAGPGLYWMMYPPHRDVSDSSAGQYVHNDYLQFLIETGWPGVALVFLCMAALVWWCLPRLLGRTDADCGIEAGGLFCGLLAVVTHSLLTFNLYLMPILIVMGLAIGRLLSLVGADRCPQPGQSDKGGRLWMSVALTVALVMPFEVYLSAATSGWRYHQAQDAKAQGSREAAVTHLDRAIEWWPEVDLYHYQKALTLYQIASAAPGEPETSLLREMTHHLEKARNLNPYRPETAVVQGLYYETFNQSSPSGEFSPEQAAQRAYMRALLVDPYSLRARFRLAKILLQNQRHQHALDVLEETSEHQYPAEKVTFDYYQLLSQMHRMRDNPGKADHYRKRAEELVTTPADRAQ